MRISFSVDLIPTSGKQVFACRLAEAFRRKGVKVVEKNANINLVIVKGTKEGCKNVLRLDGVWMNKRVDCKNKNIKLRNHVQNCAGVIYQNEFCKEASDRLLGKCRRPYACISNGIDPDIFEHRKPFQHSRPFFMAMCKWRPHKRLPTIVKAFLASGLDTDYDLLIFGDPDKKIKHKRVVYLGTKKNSFLLDALVSSVGTVHLAYVDWCPNSVIESVAAKKHVLHTDSGGTKLVVKGDGIRIKEQKPWDFSIIDLYKPPPLDIDQIAQGYRDLLNLPPIKTREDLHIDTVADQYIAFFRGLL